MLDKKLIDCIPMYKQPDTGRFGVEIEMEGVNLPEKIQGWQIKEENSLRGESREFATDRAVSMKELQLRLLAVKTALEKTKSLVNTSYRGSTHIHYNVQQETFRAVMNEWVIFTAIEPVFLSVIGGNRNGNLFCLPSFDTGDTVTSFYRQLSELVKGKAKWLDRGKYAARNSDPVRRFGSVEYRFFPPETGEKIMTWCQYLDRLWELSRSFTNVDSLHRAVQEFRSNPGVFLRIFPPDVLPPAYFLPQMIEIGAHLAYELSRKYVLLTREAKTKTTEDLPDLDAMNLDDNMHDNPEAVNLAGGRILRQAERVHPDLEGLLNPEPPIPWPVQPAGQAFRNFEMAPPLARRVRPRAPRRPEE